MSTQSKMLFESDVLLPEVHHRLLESQRETARDAGIPVRYLYVSLKGAVSSGVLDYVSKIKTCSDSGIVGLAYIGGNNSETLHQCNLIAAACLRNFILARVESVHGILHKIKKEDYQDSTVLLMPDFFISKANGGGVAAWQLPVLYDLLLDRANMERQTIVYIEDLDQMKIEYGQFFYELVTRMYQRN